MGSTRYTFALPSLVMWPLTRRAACQAFCIPAPAWRGEECWRCKRHVSVALSNERLLGPIQPSCTMQGIHRISFISLSAIILGKLFGHGRFGLVHPLAPLNGLDDLLGTKRDQDAEHDDPDFTGELAPAVQRLRQVDVHVGNVPEITEA